MQDQMEEQTIILKTLLEAWTKQEAYYKKLEAEVGLIKQELQDVKEECQAVKDELRRIKQEMADGMQPLPLYRTVLGCLMPTLYILRQLVTQVMCRRSRPLTPRCLILPHAVLHNRHL